MSNSCTLGQTRFVWQTPGTLWEPLELILPWCKSSLHLFLTKDAADGRDVRKAATCTDITTGSESSWKLKQQGKTLHHHRALLFGNVTKFPSLLLTSLVAFCHFSPFTSIPHPPHESILVAEITVSHITLPPLVLVYHATSCNLLQDITVATAFTHI